MDIYLLSSLCLQFVMLQLRDKLNFALVTDFVCGNCTNAFTLSILLKAVI
jgi:hypothetical protein